MPTTSRIDAWLEDAVRDAVRRKLPALRPLLEGMARSMAELRAADWNDDATGIEPDRNTPDAH